MPCAPRRAPPGIPRCRGAAGRVPRRRSGQRPCQFTSRSNVLWAGPCSVSQIFCACKARATSADSALRVLRNTVSKITRWPGELKRTEDGGHMELQALRYAAMVSTMTATHLVSTYAEANDLDIQEARQIITEWVGDPFEVLPSQVRIILARRTRAAISMTRITATSQSTAAQNGGRDAPRRPGDEMRHGAGSGPGGVEASCPGEVLSHRARLLHSALNLAWHRNV
jgi:hypothetical protein